MTGKNSLGISLEIIFARMVLQSTFRWSQDKATPWKRAHENFYKEFCAFLEVHFCLVLLLLGAGELLRCSFIQGELKVTELR